MAFENSHALFKRPEYTFDIILTCGVNINNVHIKMALLRKHINF